MRSAVFGSNSGWEPAEEGADLGSLPHKRCVRVQMCACRCLFAVCVRANVCECECKGVLCKCNCSLARTPWMLAQNKLPYPTNMKKSKSGPKIATTPPAHPISVSDLSPEALNAADCQTELQALQSSVVPGESVQKRHMCRLFLESFCQSSPSCHSKLL